MALRHIEAQKNLQKVHLREYPSRVSRATLTFLNRQGSEIVLEAELAAGIGVVTGGNGAGKTTLLKALSAFDESASRRWPDHLLAVELHGENGGGAWSARAQRNNAGDLEFATTKGQLPELTFVDPTEESQEVQRQILSDANAEDFLEGYDAYFLTDEWKDHASRVLQRKYDAIKIVEFEGPNGLPRPWISATCDDLEYDLTNMGRGELSTLFLFWKLNQVADNSVVVIDEPEAGLAVFAQARLKEMLAFVSVKRGIQFIITTHSPDLYLGLGGAPVTVLELLPAPFGYKPVSAFDAARALHAPRPPVLLCAFTEDAVAAALLRAILVSHDHKLSSSVEIFFSKNGESALEKVAEEFIADRRPGRAVRLVTVFDGDQRVLVNDKRLPSDERLYLPGDEAPEAVLASIARKVVTDMETEELGTVVDDVFQFRTAMSREAGSDHHDWFFGISRALGDYEKTSNVLLQICQRDSAFAQDVTEMVTGLERLLRG